MIPVGLVSAGYTRLMDHCYFHNLLKPPHIPDCMIVIPNAGDLTRAQVKGRERKKKEKKKEEEEDESYLRASHGAKSAHRNANVGERAFSFKGNPH